ncbi:hypothetical protein [Arsukibacterium indicum]|uniref:Uncharacterized protein n=1 Tax=Arsukibacterium indicum TaxID=2848612 RepID=A0ABS6MHW4_9GAMM|nr:hypothetical protein [Arsukibacterium indicum]MBV2127916.1 hypothetical protein [Arsukibacterium indicum]
MILSLVAEIRPGANNQGLIELDFDPAAERYAVMDRGDLTQLWHGVVPPTNPAKIIVPYKYTFDYNLMVLIIDDAGEPLHYVTGNDKVQAQLVDARLVTLNP